MTYPVVSSTCFPHIAQTPRLYAQPASYVSTRSGSYKRQLTHHDNISPGSVLLTTYSPCIYLDMAVDDDEHRVD